MVAVLTRIVLPLAALAFGVFAVLAVSDRMTADVRAAERRALHEREAALARAALAPGSALACLTGTVGDAVETACEKAVFASPESAAAAVVYMGARLQLLKDAAGLAARGAPDLNADFAASRRAVELDRFGLAAQVLAVREGCTSERCAAFALVGEADALKANLKARVFDQYVARHAAAWTASADKPPLASVPDSPAAAAAATTAAPAAPTAAPATTATAPAAARSQVARPLPPQYDFPSADSIPAVSIMNAEPPRPKESAPPDAAPPSSHPQDPPAPAAAAPPAR